MSSEQAHPVAQSIVTTHRNGDPAWLDVHALAADRCRRGGRVVR